jgi:hypothetical protein
MDYTTLVATKDTVGSLKYWVNHEFVPADEILKDAQAEIYSRLRTREMRVSTPLSITIGMSEIALPADFLDPLSLKDQYKSDIRLLSPDALEDQRVLDASGNLIQSLISDYAIFDEKFKFDTASSLATTFSLIYYARPVDLSGSNTTNFLTKRYTHLLRACLLKHAYAFRKAWDESERYARELEQQFQKIEVNDDLSARGMNDPEEFR